MKIDSVMTLDAKSRLEEVESELANAKQAILDDILRIRRHEGCVLHLERYVQLRIEKALLSK